MFDNSKDQQAVQHNIIYDTELSGILNSNASFMIHLLLIKPISLIKTKDLKLSFSLSYLYRLAYWALSSR